MAPSLSFCIHSHLTVTHNSGGWWWSIYWLYYVFLFFYRFGGFGWRRSTVFLDFHMITSYLLVGHWATEHRPLIWLLCEISNPQHRSWNQTEDLCSWNGTEGVFLRTSSFLDADAAISERGTLLKPWALYCAECFQHSGHVFYDMINGHAETLAMNEKRWYNVEFIGLIHRGSLFASHRT